MQALIVILAILDILVCVALVILVASQQGDSKGLIGYDSAAETFLSKSGKGTMEEKMKRLTTYLAIAFAVISVALYLLTGRSS